MSQHMQIIHASWIRTVLEVSIGEAQLSRMAQAAMRYEKPRGVRPDDLRVWDFNGWREQNWMCDTDDDYSE